MTLSMIQRSTNQQAIGDQKELVSGPEWLRAKWPAHQAIEAASGSQKAMNQIQN